MKTPTGNELFLGTYIGEIQSPDLRSACRQLTRDPEFPVWPAAISHHHNYCGGLLAHTIEVVQHALVIASGVEDVDRDVLLAACIWHDAAKVLDYEVVLRTGSHEAPENSLFKAAVGETSEYWVKSSYIEQVGHVCGSAMMFWTAARQQGNVRHEVQQAVVHAILAHHGRSEWGSPVEPQTREALILHQADMLSARYGASRNRP